MFTLTIETKNAAFEENAGEEIARILHSAARTVDGLELSGSSFPVMDYNGNTVGRWEWSE